MCFTMQVQFLKQNSRTITPSLIRSFTRADAFECCLPRTKCIRGSSCGIMGYKEPQTQQLLDAFKMSYIPPEHQLIQWKEQITRSGSEEQKYWYAETTSGKMDLPTIQTLLRFHSATKIKKAVEQELSWFAGKYAKPQMVVEHPCASTVAKFQELLYTNRNDEMLQHCNMSPNELSRLCLNRWISDDHICWMTNILNRSQTDTYCVYLNGMINKNPKTLRRFSKTIQPKPLKQILFALNVGASEGKTFLATDTRRGCHWTLCLVDLTTKKIVYGDSLAWPIPDGLVNKVKGYINAATTEDGSDYSITMCHDSDSISPSTGCHICNQNCAQFYPLQTCSSICGIVVIIMAALACLRPVVFKHISMLHSNLTKRLPEVFLRNPTVSSKYLRRVVVAWVAENKVNINYVLSPEFATLIVHPVPPQSHRRHQSSPNESTQKLQLPNQPDPPSSIHSLSREKLVSISVSIYI